MVQLCCLMDVMNEISLVHVERNLFIYIYVNILHVAYGISNSLPLSGEPSDATTFLVFALAHMFLRKITCSLCLYIFILSLIALLSLDDAHCNTVSYKYNQPDFPTFIHEVYQICF